VVSVSQYSVSNVLNIPHIILGLFCLKCTITFSALTHDETSKDLKPVSSWRSLRTQLSMSKLVESVNDTADPNECNLSSPSYLIVARVSLHHHKLL